MRPPGLCLPALCLLLFVPTLLAGPPDCKAGARTFLPCELTFAWSPSDSPSSAPYKDDLLRVEFRSPAHKTYLLHSFFDGSLRVRFSPTEAGAWTYHVLSDIKRYDDQEAGFTAADSSLPGFVTVANLRHWRTTDKKPHLWLAATVPWTAIDQPQLETWLDARRHDGFTHLSGPLLSAAGPLKPFASDGTPNPSYFSVLDDRLLAAAARGFTLDLLFADDSFLKTGILANYDAHEAIVRYLVARYGGLNVTWQGIPAFEDMVGARALLKDLYSLVQKYDGFDHPRSSGARNSTFPLLDDGWMNYLFEASSNPQLGAVEHQFTQQPEIHFVNSSQPDAFRHELWNATASGEYPAVSFESLQNEANVKVIRTWARILSGTRHWEFEPYFDVDGARAVGLNEVEYLAYADKPGIVEINLPRHKYNPSWINPITGEESELKDYRGEVFSRQTPDNNHDWILAVPRDGQKQSMLKYYYFESEDPPVQEVETDTARVPFEITDPDSVTLNPIIPAPFKVKVTRANRASRTMQYAWWGEVVGGPAGSRLLGLGASGTFSLPNELLNGTGDSLHVRLLAINANGKAYEIDRVYRLTR